MFTVIRKQKKPNKDTLFYTEKYPPSSEYNTYFHEKFVKTGKFIKSEKYFDSNNLTMVSITVWKSHSVFAEYVTDEFCYDTLIIPGNIYDKDNNIETEFSIIEE